MKTKEYWIEQLGKGWAYALKDTLKSEYMDKLFNVLTMEYSLKNIVPKQEDIFGFFKLCPREKTRIVVVTDEPIMNPSKIFECIYRQYYRNTDELFLEFNHDLEKWAEQGILVISTSMTANKSNYGAHTKYWKKFIEAVIKDIEYNMPGTIFMLWGDEAKKYSDKLPNSHVFSWTTPGENLEDKDWHCPNFKQVDDLLNYIHGEEIRIIW